jgi:sulfatase modifying factor 1
MTRCGKMGQSCCTSPEVEGGTYYRTYANSGSGPTGEGNPATVSSFRLDAYDVTVGRFRQFVNAWNGGTGYTPPAGSGKHTYLNGGNGLIAVGGGDAGVSYEPGWLASDDGNLAPTDTNLSCDVSLSPYYTWTPAPGSHESLPINCLNWYESYAFCIWDGGFLPSESEWEYVAAGGSEQREYPWGTTAPGSANEYAIYDCYYPDNDGGFYSCTGVANIAPVGTPRIIRGGDWGGLSFPADRENAPPNARDVRTGLRCARAP